MINFHNEIINYNAVSKFGHITVKAYSNALYEFCEYLAEQLNCEPSDVMLDKIYRIKTSTNKVIGYKPIDARIIDGYLYERIDIGYSKLSKKTFALRSFFKFLIRNRNFPDVISYSTFIISHYKPKSEPIPILSRHELLRLLQSLVTYSNDLIRDLLLFGLLFTTGCRISEILNIKLSDINFDEEMIILEKTKTKVQRVVVLRKGFGIIIDEYIKLNKLSNFLFVKEQDNHFQQLTRADVDQLFKMYLEKANLPPLRIHSSRHSFATFMRDAGVDLFSIMELLGHEKFQSTLNYSRAHYTRNQGIKIQEHSEVYNHLRKIINEGKR